MGILPPDLSNVQYFAVVTAVVHSQKLILVLTHHASYRVQKLLSLAPSQI